MDFRFRNSNKRARDHEALLSLQWVLIWFNEDTYGDNNEMVVGGIRTCKLVLHSDQYSILCEILLACKIYWNNGHVVFIDFRFNLTMFMALNPS